MHVAATKISAIVSFGARSVPELVEIIHGIFELAVKHLKTPGKEVGKLKVISIQPALCYVSLYSSASFT